VTDHDARETFATAAEAPHRRLAGMHGESKHRDVTGDKSWQLALRIMHIE
jgi:hypothetical protein